MTTDQWKTVEQVAGWLAQGKRVECRHPHPSQGWELFEGSYLLDVRVDAGWQFRLAPEPKTRPFTGEEARINLIGRMLVAPNNEEAVCLHIRHGRAFWAHGSDQDLETLHAERWHYRIPGSTELIPCWKVEAGQ